MRLRSLFKDSEILEAIEDHGDDYAAIARELTALERGDISRQLARYWCRQFEKTKKNGDFYLTMAVANRELRQTRTLRDPKPSDLLALVPQSEDTSRLMIFADTHCPYMHPDYIEFLKHVRDTYNPTMVIHGGDEVDHHALSFHDSDPNLDSAGVELEKARLQIDDMHSNFPDLRIVESNHGSLAYRRAKAHGIPAPYLKTYREVLFPNGGGLGWSWHDTLRFEMQYGRDVQVQHVGPGDLMKLAAHENANLIVGHEHSKFGIGYCASRVDEYWSMYLGCGIDRHSLAFAYGHNAPAKPVLGCAVVTDGIPFLIPMRLDKHERWTGK